MKHAAPAPACVDWSRPWLAPYRDAGLAVERRVRSGTSIADALDALAAGVDGAPRFVAGDAAGREPYEAYIARTGAVPTRDDLHDMFNGLVWLRRPALKRRLNALHAAEIAARGIGDVRGALRDAATLLDENGALLVGAPAALVQALRSRDWNALFVRHRALWHDATLELVGHALLDKLSVAPRKAVTAHVVVVDDGGIDAALARLADKPFAPLPVLGVPGWWPANADAAFYDDAAVFRPAGSPRSTGSARRCRS